MRPGYVTPLHTLKHQNSSKHAESCCHFLPQIFFVQLVTYSRQPSLLVVALQHFVGRTKSILPTSSSQKSAGSSVGPAAEVAPICALWLQKACIWGGARGKKWQTHPLMQMDLNGGMLHLNGGMLLNGFQWNSFCSYLSHIWPKLLWISMNSLSCHR